MKTYLYNVVGRGRAFFVRANGPAHARAQVIAFCRDHLSWPLRTTRWLRVTRVPYGVFTVGPGGMRMSVLMFGLSRNRLYNSLYSSTPSRTKSVYTLPLTPGQADYLLHLVTIAELAIGEHNRDGWLPIGHGDARLMWTHLQAIRWGAASLKQPLRDLAVWRNEAGA
jgi:hypothetical protein